MALARFERDFTDEAGNLLTGNVTVEVRRMTGGLPQLYSDRDGADALGNPFIHDGGRVAFHAAGNAYRVTVTQGLFSRELTYVALGLAGETDFTFARNQGEWDDAATYARGDYVIHEGFGLFISTEEGNLNHEPDSTTPGSTEFWTYYPGVAGPPGEGLHYDVQVDELADRSAFDAEAEGFSVLVSDVGGGRAAIYVMGSGGSGDWGAPAYVTGEPGAGDVTKAANRAALKALNTATNTVAYLTEGKRAGTFVWMSGDYSAWVTLDTEEGVYIPADSDPTGAAGVWMRVYAGALNVWWFGADPTFSADSSPAIKCARDLLQTNSDYRGGEIFIPKGRYVCNSTIEFTYYASGQVHNIYVRGEGVLATTLSFAGATAGTDGIVFGPGAHFGISDLMITGAKRRGLSIDGGSGFSSNYSVARLRIQQSTTVNFYNNKSFLGSMEDIWLADSATGFQLAGFHTSMHVRRVYASGHSGAGFSIIGGVTYSTFINCAADLNNWGYVVSNVNGVTFISCGTESNVTDGWLIRTSNALASGVTAQSVDIRGLALIGCFNYNNNTGGPAGSFANIATVTTADARPIDLTVRDCTSWVHNVADYSLILAGTSGAITMRTGGNSFDGAGTFRSGATTVYKDEAASATEYGSVNFAVANTWTAVNQFNAGVAVNYNAASLLAAISGTAIQMAGADSTQLVELSDTFNATVTKVARRSNGTKASPSALAALDTIFSFQARGYGSTAYSLGRAAFNFLTTQTWTDANQGTKIIWQTTPNNSTTMRTILEFGQDGSLLAVVPLGGIGYGTGAGGAVTQVTSRTTGVTLDKVSGAITLVSAAGSATFASFTVTNSAVAATDTIIVVQKSGADLYEIHVTAVAAGSFRVTFRTTGGTTTEQPVFSFAVIKAVAA